MSELEDRLRAELRRGAERAPGGTLLAERIIAAARTQPSPAGRRGWPTWTLPLLAAGAVAAIVAGVLVGVAQIRTSGAPEPAVSQRGRSNAPSVLNSASPPGPSARPSPTATTTNPLPNNPVGLTNFAATDLTFYGTEDGWALGTADCLAGSGTCPAMVRTIDGGKSWHSMPQPPGGVTGIRFATPQIGYAYSDSVFETTADGGQTWMKQSGGAIALETLNGNVVRLVSPHTGCPGPCQVRAEYAPVGSASCTNSDFGPLDGIRFQLVRSEADAYVLVTRNPAGGAEHQQSTLYASTDNGASWVARGEPCPQPGGEEWDSIAVTAAPSGTVVALCRARVSGTHPNSLVVSHDAGASFTPAATTLPDDSFFLLAGDPATVLVAAGAGAYRSTDGGASWDRIADIRGTVSFVGFESETLGRIVTDGGRTVWTTRDGGVHWRPFTFPS